MQANVCSLHSFRCIATWCRCCFCFLMTHSTPRILDQEIFFLVQKSQNRITVWSFTLLSMVLSAPSIDTTLLDSFWSQLGRCFCFFSLTLSVLTTICQQLPVWRSAVLQPSLNCGLKIWPFRASLLWPLCQEDYPNRCCLRNSPSIELFKTFLFSFQCCWCLYLQKLSSKMSSDSYQTTILDVFLEYKQYYLDQITSKTLDKDVSCSFEYKCFYNN